MKICSSCYATVDTDARFCGLCGAELSALETGADQFLGQVIADKYSIECLLGHGGMGDVYLAYDRALDDRPVAVKIINQRFRGDVTVITRFRNEARSIARIQHPNAVMLLDHGLLSDGTIYLIMEYVPGYNLAEHMHKHGPIQHRMLMLLATQLSEVLAMAHQQGVIHRDLKPDNIMLNETSPGRFQLKVLDFGIAKLLDDPKSRLTQAGTVFGTPEFMSPEQAQGHEVDHRSDIYALGIIMYFMLTHRLLFEGQNQLAILNKQIREPPIPPSQRRPDIEVDPGLEAIIMGCLEKDRDLRYPSCEMVLGDLDRVTAGEMPSFQSQSVRRHHTKLSGEAPALDLLNLDLNTHPEAMSDSRAGAPMDTIDETVEFGDTGPSEAPIPYDSDMISVEDIIIPAPGESITLPEKAIETRATSEPSLETQQQVSSPAEGRGSEPNTEPAALLLGGSGDEVSGFLALGDLEVGHHYKRERSSSGGMVPLFLLLLALVGGGVVYFMYSGSSGDPDEEPPAGQPVEDVASGATTAPPETSDPATTTPPETSDPDATAALPTPDASKPPDARSPIPSAIGPDIRLAARVSLTIDHAEVLFAKGKFEDTDKALQASLLIDPTLPKRLTERADALGKTNKKVRDLLDEGVKQARSIRKCKNAESTLETLRPLSSVAAETLDRKVKDCFQRLRSAPGELPE